MLTDYREIGNEILKKLDVDPTRLGGALSMWSDVVRGFLESDAWDEVPMHCESASELCDKMQSSEELSDVIDAAYARGIFHAYEGISHLYRAEEAKEGKNSFEERAELAKAINRLEKSQQSFHFFEDRDQWNEAVIWLSLGRLYRSRNRLNEALLAFQTIWRTLVNRLSIERMQEIEKVASIEIEKTRRLFSDQKPFAPGELRELPPPTQHKVIPFKIPIIREIAAGREKPVSDDIIEHIQQAGELEFEFEGQALKVEPLRGDQLIFLPEYGCVVAVPISGDSMDQAGISPNDYVILQKPKDVSLQPSSGDIVAVVFRDEDNEATLRRFYFDKSSASVTLEPESSNPKHETRVLQPEAFAGDNPSVAVVGIAIAVLKPPFPLIGETAAGKEKPVSKEQLSKGPPQKAIEGSQDIWAEFVKKAGAVAIWDRESQKVIFPLKKKLSMAFKLANKESKPEEWEPLREALSDFCQYSFSTPVSKALVEELRQLVAELVSNIIADLSLDKHLASVKQYLKDFVKQLQHL